MTFVKGVSGNPTGRPKEDPELTERLKNLRDTRTIPWMETTMDDPEASEMVKLKICDLALQYTTQKPTQKTENEHTVKDERRTALSVEKLEAIASGVKE